MEKRTKILSLLNDVFKRPKCSTCPTCPRALGALSAQVPKYILQTEKLKKWKLCTRMFIRVLSLILDLNFAIS